MTKRGRKRRDNEEDISITPEEEIEESVEEEIIEEYIDYVDILKAVPSPLPELPKTRKIKYLGVDVFIIRGPVTGQRYRFTAKDRISEVAIEDYEGLLQRVRPARRCCGGKHGESSRTVPSQPYFGPA